jgi:hypothetical protein
MLKNKERRDSLLLVFMAIIMVIFLLYVFLPSGGGKKENGKNQDPGTKTLPEDSIRTSVLETLNREISAELKALYSTIISSPDPFEDLSTRALVNLPSRFKSELVDKLSNFSFNDLADIATWKFPVNYNDSLKFNLYLSFFLVKLKAEEIGKKCADLSWSEFEQRIDFTAYSLLKNEVTEDYQLLPVLFYFKLLTDRLNLYPWVDTTLFFKEKIKPLKDATASKNLDKIRDILEFSQRRERYRVEWVEDDGIGPDDKNVYNSLNLRTMHFLKQEYLIFPDEGDDNNNRWLRDLYEADSGDIELIGLSIRLENPAHPSQLRKIVYSPLNSQFVVLLQEYTRPRPAGFLDRMLAKCIKKFHDSFTVIGFLGGEAGEDSLKEALNAFGNHLKKNRLSAVN